MVKNVFQHFVIFILLALLGSVCHAKIINTVFGKIDETNPAVLELIESTAMQRLKSIDQSGPNAYFIANFPKFSRYEHSLGVYALLKRYNVSIEEQIAGLLHDASHTVFSHLGDYIFQNGEIDKGAYQDNIHEYSLSSMGVKQILLKHKLSLAQVSPKNPNFSALEQSYPDMNADRIEYNLHTALILKDLTPLDVEQILASLNYDKNKWYFTDMVQAKKFAKLSTYYNKAFWGSGQNIAIYSVAVAMFKYALQEQIISAEDLHFNVDEFVIAKLERSGSKTIKQLLAIMRNIDKHYIKVTGSEYDVSMPVKMRGIDPLVLVSGRLRRLTELSNDFNSELILTKDYCQHKVAIKFINISDPDILQLIVAANRNI